MNNSVKECFNQIKEIKKQIPNSDNKEELSKKIIEITKKLKENAIKQFSNPSSIKIFLDNVGRFNNYSYMNILFLLSQKKDIKYVASFKTYKDLGYKINKEHESLNILVPVFKTLVKDNRTDEIRYYSTLDKEELKIYKDKTNDDIVFHEKKLSHFAVGTVFDISDTNMPYDEIKEKLHPNVDNENAKQYISVLEKLIEENNFKLIYVDKCDCDGYCDLKNKQIVILDGQTNLVKLKTILHEYAHSTVHTKLENDYQEYQNNRNKYEVEAESISYVVSNYLNLKVPEFSEMYLYSWSKNKDFKEIDNSLNIIVNNSINIIKKIDEKTNELIKLKEFTKVNEK